MSKFFKVVFDFFASLKLAVVVLSGLGIVLAYATFLESKYDAEYARFWVYQARWFSVLLAFLGINVLFAALSRWPWKRQHIGFVVVHAGILILLVGAVITQRFGVEGQIPLFEGERVDFMTADPPVIRIYSPDFKGVSLKDKQREFPVYFKMDTPSLDRPWESRVEADLHLRVDAYYPNSNCKIEGIKSTSVGSPALNFVLSNLPGGQKPLSHWLFLGESENLGPAQILFLQQSDFLKLGDATETSPETNPSSRVGRLELYFEGRTVSFGLEELLKSEVTIPDSPYRLQALRYLPDARVRGQEMVNQSDVPNNPALEFKILGPEIDEWHVVFEKFPDLEGVRSSSEKKSNIQSRLILNQPSFSESSRILYFAASPSGELSYRLRNGAKVSLPETLPLSLQKPTGWMGMEFRVDQFIEQADKTRSCEPVYVSNESERSALHLTIKDSDQSKSIWLQESSEETFDLAGVPYRVGYGYKRHLFGFDILLKQFKIDYYPGGKNPKSYESLVEVTPVSNPEAKFETTISMNEPLEYQGYSFYQTSYQLGENGQPHLSVFSVAKDPGMPAKTVGSIVLVAGIILIFWFRPFFLRKR